MILVKVRPGPVLQVFDGGKLVVSAPLSWRAALNLASDLIGQSRDIGPAER